MKKEYLFDLLLEKKIKIDYDVFDYGLTTLIVYLKFIIIILPLSLILNIKKEIIVFLLFFIPLRRYIGGYHLKSNYSCLIASVLCSVLISFLSKYTPFLPLYIRLILLLICLFFVFKIGTVDHPNKKLKINEKKYYKKKSLTVVMIYMLFIVFLYNYENHIVLNTALYALLFSVISLILANYKKKL